MTKKHKTTITVAAGGNLPDYVLVQKSLNQFRALRLWHWKRYLEAQNRLNALDNLVMDPEDKTARSRAKRQMNFHVEAVQTLNDLFPQPHDTVDEDLKKEGLLNVS